ncbi:calcium/sodium antiporter [Larsenimonas rhizosphaerae]|uniref:calcium/sodium antiporter n=1 Tax=Larsenimonas rhizosphaerae TaxID=2944682 RepID=UPI0020335B94|nr:calcium/sodium antiporter [Larsenimonas rhizosphaerae]MCM2130498.1 calcium/sodium antiporter [Larsenimonas rhizosphaerae]
MLTASLAVIGGLILLIWSANRFVDGAAATARYAGMPPLLIGMVVVGFGTSAPEMVVSASAAFDGNPELALGNALGSNIANIGLILGLTALIAPITVDSTIVRRELPLLLVACALAGLLLWNNALTRMEAFILLLTLAALLGWSIRTALTSHAVHEPLAADMVAPNGKAASPGHAIIWLIIGLVLLVASSRLLVWGAVVIAQGMGISDLVIGLTVVAIGTSLPELAASVIAARKGESGLVIGNVVGSNLFNILAVIGIAGAISPMHSMSPDIIMRDWSIMMALTVTLLLMSVGTRHPGRVSRLEGGLLLAVFSAYTGWLVASVTGP